MKVMLSETVTHFHEVELSDELDIEKIIDMANALKKRCDSGSEAIETVLQAYKNKHGEAFDFKVSRDAGGIELGEISYEYPIED